MTEITTTKDYKASTRSGHRRQKVYLKFQVNQTQLSPRKIKSPAGIHKDQTKSVTPIKKRTKAGTTVSLKMLIALF